MYFPNAKIVASEHDVTFIGYERKKEYFNGVKKLYWNEKYKNEKKKEIQALKICDLVLPHNPDNVDVLKNCGIAEDRICWLIPAYNDLSQCNRNSNGIVKVAAKILDAIIVIVLFVLFPANVWFVAIGTLCASIITMISISQTAFCAQYIM